MPSAKNRKAFVLNPYHLLRWAASLPPFPLLGGWLGAKVDYILLGHGQLDMA